MVTRVLTVSAKFLLKNLLNSLMGVPLYIICGFSLAAF